MPEMLCPWCNIWPCTCRQGHRFIYQICNLQAIVAESMKLIRIADSPEHCQHVTGGWPLLLWTATADCKTTGHPSSCTGGRHRMDDRCRRPIMIACRAWKQSSNPVACGLAFKATQTVTGSLRIFNKCLGCGSQASFCYCTRILRSGGKCCLC